MDCLQDPHLLVLNFPEMKHFFIGDSVTEISLDKLNGRLVMLLKVLFLFLLVYPLILSLVPVNFINLSEVLFYVNVSFVYFQLSLAIAERVLGKRN